MHNQDMRNTICTTPTEQKDASCVDNCYRLHQSLHRKDLIFWYDPLKPKN